MPDADRLGEEDEEVTVEEDGGLDPETEARFDEKVRVRLALLRPEGPRPKTRGDCLAGGPNAARPCRWITCQWYLPRMTLNPKHTCALDVADQGGVTLEEVGDLMGITRERIRQIEFMASRKIAKMDRNAINRGKLRDLAEGDATRKEWQW